MNIAIVGPEKYRFQDLVCVELALSLRGSELTSMVPEPSGGEDTEFKWRDGQSLKCLEVQVKGSQKDLRMAFLAEYLTHYPERQTDGSLLERLIDDHHHGALFVTSGRLTDPLTEFRVMSGMGRCPAPHPVAEATMALFIAELRRLSEAIGTTMLQRARIADIGRLASLSSTKLRDGLSRVFIIAEETHATVETRLHARLRSLRFDTLSLRGTIAALTDELNLAKRSQNDLLGPIYRCLDVLAPEAVAPQSYIELGIEEGLLDQLEARRVLLLSGAPRAGKSWTHRALGGVLQKAGYEVRQGTSVEEAERFLTDASGGERLFLLDDPFGSRESAEKAAMNLSVLRRLIENLPRNRRLIVAQVDHVLYELCRSSDLAKCSVGAFGWTPILPVTIEKAKIIWSKAADAMKLDASATARIDALIERDDRLRSPGALTYLAQAMPDLPATTSDDALIVFAHGDAADFARILVTKGPDMEPLLVAAAIATEIDRGAFVRELAYIIDGDDTLPGLEAKRGVLRFSGGPRHEPNYTIQPALTAGQTSVLDQLSRRRVIENRQQRVNFTHPYLRAAAQTLMVPDLPSDLDHMRCRLLRGIGSLSPETSLAVARNLAWIGALLVSGASPNISYAIAEEGLRSIFPATRDACFSYLLKHAEGLPCEMRDEMLRWAENVVTDLDHIVVQQGFAFLSSDGWTFDERERVRIEEIQPYLDAIEGDQSLDLDLPLSRQILRVLRDHPGSLTRKIVDRFLHADEAMVRAEAARIWLSAPRVHDDEVLCRLTGEEAPAIGVAVLDGMVRAWADIDDARRERLLDILALQAQSLPTASVVFSRLVLFNRVEEFGENPPWIAFARAMPVILDRLPSNVALNNGRFNIALEYAIMAGLKEELVPTLQAWSRRSAQRLHRYSLYKYELSIIDPLLNVARAETRRAILEDQYKLADTGARMVLAADLADRWGLLERGERDRFLSWISEDRSDWRWVAATLLTRRYLDPEIMLTIIGLDDLERLSPSEIEEMVGKDLFVACVQTFVGRPQPLWRYGKHHGAKALWGPIVRALARDAGHPMFDVAFYEVVSFEDEATVKQVVSAIAVESLPRAFAAMLSIRIATEGAWRCAAWVTLLDRGERANLLDVWLPIIDAKLEAILEDFGDLNRWLASSRFADRIAKMLHSDVRALTAFKEICQEIEAMEAKSAAAGRSKTVDPRIMSALFDAELERVEVDPPRLLRTWCRIKDYANRLNASETSRSRVEAQRLTAINRKFALQDAETVTSSAVPLEGWIDTALSARDVGSGRNGAI
ncbi:hypothetical protein [Acetobacter fabarum]|uniref:nSTAND3 domain-containing NTPase n=1 Tax=Acetobacter fabarum TaxID=483199 RepID=UPI0039ED5E90